MRKCEEKWLMKCNLVKEYCKYHGDVNIPSEFKTFDGFTYNEDGYSLGYWLGDQRKAYHEGTLSDDRINLLMDIGVDFNFRRKANNWVKMYELLKKYYEYYGNSEVGYRFKTKDGITYDEDGYKLGGWVFNVRRYQETLSEERIKMLKLLDFRFGLIDHDEIWHNNYKLAETYYNHYGNLLMPLDFRTNDGINMDESGFNLNHWIKCQIKLYKENQLDEYKYELLKNIDVLFDTCKYDVIWDNMYSLAYKYFQHYGDLEVKFDFKTEDGFTYSSNGKALGNWVKNQRTFYKADKLSDNRKKMLEKIGMRFEGSKHDLDWEEMYCLLKKYIKHYKNADVPKSFITKNGFKGNNNSYKLGEWLSRQREQFRKGKLSLDRQKRLQKLGVVLEVTFEKEDNWNNMYSLAVNYYKHYGNLEIVRSFKTKNGYEIDENGYKLGVWINVQRTHFKTNKLSDDRINLLNSIGMIWNTVKNKDDIKTLCIINGIDYELNKDVLLHMSYQELYVKIEYLKSQSILIINDGKLHEIFSMSSLNMEVKYGVSLEKLINNYYCVDSVKKIRK